MKTNDGICEMLPRRRLISVAWAQMIKDIRDRGRRRGACKKRWAVMTSPELGGICQTVIQTNFRALAMFYYLRTAPTSKTKVTLYKRSGPPHDGIWDPEKQKGPK